MGKRLNNWISKASSDETRRQWQRRWRRFAEWVVTTQNPLTDTSYMDCPADQVDEVIRRDFETMPSHLFQDKYRDILTKYLASMVYEKSNTAIAYISSVRSFFSNECAAIRLQRGKIPQTEIAMDEHRFNLNELRRMWHVADLEGKARLNTALSLGWGIGDFKQLTLLFMRNVLAHVDEDGYASFDYRRKKTKARIRGILKPDAVQDLTNYLASVPDEQMQLWSVKSKDAFNYWIKKLAQEAGINRNGRIRFHLLRKYVFDTVTAQCGSYEAKLLVGKKIPLADATYLHGLEDRLLERYKQFAYPMLRLNGQRVVHEDRIGALETKLEQQAQVLEYLQDENKVLKTQLTEIRTTRRESDQVMDQLFQDPQFMEMLREKLRKIR